MSACQPIVPCSFKIDQNYSRKNIDEVGGVPTVSNKNMNLAVYYAIVYRVYLRNHLSYKKVIYIYLHPRLKSS